MKRTLTIEHRRKISEANRKRKGMKMKRKVSLSDKEVVRMWREGATATQIAEKFGCHFSTIKRRLEDVGIQNVRDNKTEEPVEPIEEFTPELSEVKKKKAKKMVDRFIEWGGVELF